MNKLDEQYRGILAELLYNGREKGDRTGTGTLSKFGMQIRHSMSEGFPLLTTKKMPFKTITTELLWFLKGDTNIKYLVNNGCNIWNGDAYKRYEMEFEKGNAPGETLLVQRVEGKSTKRKFSMEKFIAMIQHDDEFAKKWGDLVPGYGSQWRSWNSRPWIPSAYLDENGAPVINGSQSKHGGMTREIKVIIDGIDQIENLINELKTNPDSRRLMVSAWNVGEIDQMVLPPCHYGFQVYTRELSFEERFRLWNSTYMPMSQHTTEDITMFKTHTKEENEKVFSEVNVPTRAISLMWNQRSVDTFLGLPFNIASYGLLLEMIAKEVNMVTDELIGNLGDVHLYSNHIEQAKEQVSRDGFDLPTIKLSNVDILNGEFDYELINYTSATAIKAPLSN